jgi:DNA-binding CsgD family transcriptional regulator
MPSGAVAYKDAPAAQAEALDLNERLWDHIRLATSFVDRQRGLAAYTRNPPSAVVVRKAGEQAVVIVLVDRLAPPPSDPVELCRSFGLTPRETDVALLLAERMSCREIANRLNMSFHTARCHTERILVKLSVRSKNDVSARLGVGQ